MISALLTTRPAAAVVPGAYTYDSKLTGTRYVLNTDARNQRQAEAGCIALGGHLVSYTSAQEQVRPDGASATTPHVGLLANA